MTIFKVTLYVEYGREERYATYYSTRKAADKRAREVALREVAKFGERTVKPDKDGDFVIAPDRFVRVTKIHVLE